MIPKIIHTCYFSQNNDIPQSMSLWVNKLKEKYNDFEIKIWTKDNIVEFNTGLDIDTYINQGYVGQLYLSYYIRFYALDKYGGFYIDDHYELVRDLHEILNNKFVFEISGFESINVDFFGVYRGDLNFTNDPIKSICDKLKDIVFINPNGSLNLYNPHQLLGKCIKDNSYIFDDNFNYSIKNINGVNFALKLNTKRNNYLQRVTPTASIVIPIYNGAQYLHECIDSILSQSFKDIEIIFVDDGSTDSTKDIILSYRDDRIVYHKKDHSGIVDTLNVGIRRALGKYIIRHDADDVMLNNRLAYQIEFMESNSDVDILSSGYIGIKSNGEENGRKYRNPVGYVSLEMLAQRNHLAHPTSCFRTSSIKNLPFLYEGYYECAEDYKLWCTAASRGLKIYSDGEYVIKYRMHENQISSSKQDAMWRSTKMIQNTYRKKSGGELTCIIPFQNEGHEIERTVASIRATAQGVNILLVNDCSTDGVDYRIVADLYDCEYYETETNLGVAGCRDFAVEHCKTEYFVLLDGHMRFYDYDWDVVLLNKLKEYPNSLVTGNTLVFHHDTYKDLYTTECHFGYDKVPYRAALINNWELGESFTGKWTNNTMPGFEKENIVSIACCMGAVYGCSKSWWTHIGGLKGLMKWGQDEPYMSLKTWLAGGQVLLLTDFAVGHLYRSCAAYLVPNPPRLLNRIFLINFFLRDQNEVVEHLEHLKKKIGETSYNEAMELYNENKSEYERLKDHFWNNVASPTLSLQWFYESVNDKIKNATNK